MKAQKARSVYATFLFALIGLHVSFFFNIECSYDTTISREGSTAHRKASRILIDW